MSFDPAKRRFTGTTENVARLKLDVGRALPASNGPIEVELDGQTLAKLSPAVENGSRLIRLARKSSTWSAMAEPVPPSHKGPHRYGPFKDAFRHRFVLVYGTKGTAEENAWSLARARYDAEVFGYRGNGSVDIVPDATFLDPAREAEFRDRGVILYGHAESHGAWPALLADSPVQVRRGQVAHRHARAGGRRPRLPLPPPSPRQRPGLRRRRGRHRHAGLAADRAAALLRLGRGLSRRLRVQRLALEKGDSALRAAGFFGVDWGVETGEFAP